MISAAAGLQSIRSGMPLHKIGETHWLSPVYGWGAPGTLLIPSPMFAARVCLLGSARGGGAVLLRHGRAGSGFPDVERTMVYTRNGRAVKVTYWGLIFFCKSLMLFGVSRSLGYPPGGLRYWLRVIWEEGGWL